MNNQIVKLGIRLFLFCLFAAVALGVTNEVTKGPIAEQALASKMAALRKVMPGDSYEEISYENLPDNTELDELFVATKENGEVDGYALTASPQGYGGEIPITVGVSKDGYVTQVYVGSLQETAGLGSRVGEAEFMDQFIGIPASADTLRDDVSTISGASISSGAFLRATEDVLRYTENTLGIAPSRGDKDAILAAWAAANGGGEAAEPVVTTESYAVTGFADFNVEVSVDQDGKIVSVTVPENNETPGLGADLIADAAVFEALVGQDIAQAQIDVRTGVTLTSNAINEALKKAAGGDSQVYEVTGFAPFKVAIALEEDGTIKSVTVPENNETPGLGADLIADTAVFDALVGKDIADAKIDVRAGVTLTSNAINDALAQAAKAAGAAPAVAGDPYTVKGMNKFTLYIEAADGKIVSAAAPDNNETPGLGADILTDEALAKLAGQDLSTAGVDVKAGVTLTSNAINQAIAMAALANGVERAQEPEAETPAEEEAAAEPAAEAAEAFAVTAVNVTGMSDFTVEIATDEDGKIVSVAVPAHNETPGLGAALIEDADTFASLVGKEISEAAIDVKAGVTLTSNAINEALTKAAKELGKAAAAEEATAEAVAEAAEAAAEQVEEATEEVKAEAEAAAETVAEKAAEAAEAVKETVSGLFSHSTSVTGIAPFTVNVETDEDGKITAVTVPEHSETPGLGADLIENAETFAGLIGKDISEAAIDVKAGVTLTSNAINDALKDAANAFSEGKETAAEAAEEAAAAVEAETEKAADGVKGAAAAVEAEAEKAVDAVKEAAAGFAHVASVTGIAPFTVNVETDEEGKITAVTVPEHSETPGLGADLIENAETFAGLIGKDISEAAIDVKAGVTLTSNAINDALKDAAKAFSEGKETAAEAAEEAAAAVEAETEKAADEVKEAAAAVEAEAEKAVDAVKEAAAGFAHAASVTGIAPFTVNVETDADGKITSVTVPEHSETPGLGAALIEDADVFAGLVGKDIHEAAIDVRAGVTLTSNAINEALKDAAKAFGGAAAATTVTEEVTGFAPFKVEITVEDGKIVSVVIPENSETPGLGADLLADTAVLEALQGKDIEDAQIDVRAGVTLTSNAMNEALKKAAEEVRK